ncbi:hypothetical protein [Pseudomonas baltica]|uniref:hypothetical protein n=1 Tax=Pseudomonas baltica TaxID=2762576 RepID=UPI001FCE6935|nr:hypothetical protein [Pseudomonas baltica]
MLINGLPLNAAALGGLQGDSSATEPLPIVPGRAFRWRLRVTVGGSDVTARLTGQVHVDRERGAAGLADFTLQMDAGPVVPMDWIGAEVVIDYISTAAGVTSEKRRYTGRIVTTEWGSLARLLVCHCGDQLQQRVEAMSTDAVGALIPSYWSDEVFEAIDGRSRWDYAQERLTSVQGSLDSSATGELRLTSWYAGNIDFTFGGGTTVYDSVALSYADLTSLTNTVEIEANYRFPRLRQLNENFTWVHPDTNGLGGLSGFCQWRPDSTELPDVAMVRDAVTGSGLSLVRNPGYNRVPLSAPDPCGNGQPWVNNYADLLLAASLTGGRRWSQPVTEKYTLKVVAETSVAQAGEVIARESLSIEYTNDLADGWESTAFGIDAPRPAAPGTGNGVGGNGAGGVGGAPAQDGGETGHKDQRDEAQRLGAFRCLLHQAKTSIIQAHSGTRVSWESPTSMVMDVDLVHTLAISDQGISAAARCSHIYDTFDLAGGSAITTLTITVMRGGGTAEDALEPPAASVEPQPEPDGPDPIGRSLPTQLGGKRGAPAYKEDLDGFAGNYDNADPTLEVFPRRFQVTSIDIPEEDTDEKTVDIAATYRVVIPNDLLEL